MLKEKVPSRQAAESGACPTAGLGSPGGRNHPPAIAARSLVAEGGKDPQVTEVPERVLRVKRTPGTISILPSPRFKLCLKMAKGTRVPLPSLKRTWGILTGRRMLGLTLRWLRDTAPQSCRFTREEEVARSSTAHLPSSTNQDGCRLSQSPRQRVREVDSSMRLE